MKTFALVLLAILATLFGFILYYHNSVFILKGPDNGFLLTKPESIRYSAYLPAFYVHIITGSLVLLTGVTQLSKWIRAAYPKWHRLSGKIYISILLIFTAPSGFVMGLYANGGLAAGASFVLLATLWWFFTWKGWKSALSMRWDLHRQFMMRSYALTFSAVTLRLYSFFFALAGYKGEFVYIIIAWLSWVPSLIVMEMYMRQKAVHRNAIER